MAEAVAVVGLVASIVQLVEFGGSVAARLRDFQSNSQDVSATLRGIQTRLPLILDAVKYIKEQADSGLVVEQRAKALQPVVKGCEQAVEKLDSLLTTTLPADGASNREKFLKALKSLSCNKEVEQLASLLEANIGALTLHQVTTTIRQDSFEKLGDKSAVPNRKPVFLVPFPRDFMFVGREAVLADLEPKLEAGLRRIAFHGIGGVGKTQIAREYCYRHVQKHPSCHVFWIMCNSLNRFEQAYRDVARKLGLPGFEDPKTNILNIVQEWLNENGQWLMILDNADDKELIFGSSHVRSQAREAQRTNVPLIKYIPQTSFGALIITTRDKRVGESIVNRVQGSLITVASFNFDDSMQLVRNNYADAKGWNEIEARKLFSCLNYLPLAISQAAAYISEQQTDLSSYLELLLPLKDDAKDLLEQPFYDPGRDSDIQNSILETWTLSFRLIRKQKPRAAELLSFMAVLDRQSIPDTLLQRSDQRKVDFDTAISTLKSFSLIVPIGGKRTAFSMHRLVQIATQRWLENEKLLPEWQEKALIAVSRSCPPTGDDQHWSAWELINPHVQIVLDYNVKGNEALSERARLLTRLSNYDYVQGRVVDAEAKASEAFSLISKIQNVDDELSLASLHAKGAALSSQERWSEAETIFQEVWESCKRTLGEQHDLTLQSMNDLAEEKKHGSKFAEAETLLRHNWAISRKKLGPDHLITMKVMTNLAATIALTGKSWEAEDMLRQALSRYVELLGTQNTETVFCMNELGLVLHIRENMEEAVVWLRNALEISKSFLLESHYNIVTIGENLAEILVDYGEELQHQGYQEQAMRKFEEAEQLFRSALTHPSPSGPRFRTIYRLRVHLEHQNRYEDAETLMRESIESGTEVMGQQHPAIMDAMHKLAYHLVVVEKFEEAERLLQLLCYKEYKVFKDREQSIQRRIDWSIESRGIGHEDTLYMMRRHAFVRNNAATAGVAWAKTEVELKSLIELHQKHLGEDHEKTVLCFNRLLSLEGRFKEAEKSKGIEVATKLRET